MASTYDGLTTLLSRHLVNSIKKREKKGEILFDFPGKKSIHIEDLHVSEFTPEITVQYKIKYDKKSEIVFDIYGQADDETIELEMIINPNYLHNKFSEIIPIIKDAIRHELEHVAQNNLYRPESERYEKISIGSFFKYLTAKHEIPAFVRGMYKGAKTMKVPFSKYLDNFIDVYSERLTEIEQDNVRHIWSDYAKRNLPKAIFVL